MNLTLRSTVILLCTYMAAQGQTETESSAALADGSVTAAAPAYSVMERGSHFRRWQAIYAVRGPTGDQRYSTNVYTELQNGLCFRDPNTGEWQDASDQIEIQPDGGAVAERGQCRLYFPGSLYQEAIECRTADRKTLTTRPIGLVLSDGEQSVLVAQLRDGPTGQLLPSGSQVIYTNILDAVKCDLLVEYKRSGYEASLIFREKFDPHDWGFTDPDKVRVRWLTEFFNPPAPAITQIPLRNGLTDNLIDFGEVQMAAGTAFSLGDAPQSSARVCKQWLTIDSGTRTVLSEEVPWPSISEKVGSFQSELRLCLEGARLRRP